jgi:hypothetical protein
MANAKDLKLIVQMLNLKYPIPLIEELLQIISVLAEKGKTIFWCNVGSYL